MVVLIFRFSLAADGTGSHKMQLFARQTELCTANGTLHGKRNTARQMELCTANGTLSTGMELFARETQLDARETQLDARETQLDVRETQHDAWQTQLVARQIYATRRTLRNSSQVGGWLMPPPTRHSGDCHTLLAPNFLEQFHMIAGYALFMPELLHRSS